MSIQRPQRAAVATVPALESVHPTLSPVPGAGHPVRGNAARKTDVVIVGIDGSGCARHAAGWAAQEAVRRHAVLSLVFAYHLPAAGSSGSSPSAVNLLTDLREEGWGVLADTAAVLRRANPGLRTSMKLVYGHPAAVLRKASKRALLTVVGSHGANRVTVALGSVAAEVAQICSGPVAVIRSTQSASNGPVVVGVDGSPTSRGAIDYAFAAADARKAPLIAVHCWTDPSVDKPIPAHSAGAVTVQQIQDEQRTQLADELAGSVEKYPDVTVQLAVIHDRPAAGLLEYAPFAQLIVAGSRGHGGIVGMLLGSTGQALIAQCTCPVVIVRPTPVPSPR